MPGTVLGPGNIVMNMSDKESTLKSGRRQTKVTSPGLSKLLIWILLIKPKVVFFLVSFH